jgi:hypothetical protein
MSTGQIMEIHFGFWFRGIEYSCSAVIDNSEYPCYIFTTLKHPGLISEFGDEITVVTDGKKRLAKKEDYPALVQLNEAILQAIKAVPEFRAVKIKTNILRQRFLKI